MTEGAREGSVLPAQSQVLRDTLSDALAGRYEALEGAGEGGMAIVFRARDVRHGRPVAIKVLRPELAAGLSADRFRQEIEVEARLNHPNVLTLLESGEARGLFYYVALWAEEGSLRDRLRRSPPLTVTETVRLALEVGDALAHAHRHGVVHRDVKPENILFRSGHALLADFGIARLVEGPSLSATTLPGIVVGTVHYMSPEQITAGEPIDGRSDQYALACVLFEMLVGDPPFTGRDPRVVLARHLADRPPSISAVRPEVPALLEEVLGRALSKRPDDRFPTMEAFLAALEEYRSGAHSGGHRVIGGAVGRRVAWGSVAVAAAATFVTAAMRGDTPLLAATNVAVLPLEVRGVVNADSGIGIGIAYLIEAALERAEPLRLLDAGAELTPERRLDPGAVPMNEARRLARRLNAAWLLRGAVQQHDDSVTVILRLFDVRGDSLARTVSATGAVGQVALHQLGIDAVHQLLPMLTDPGTTVDVEALRSQDAPAVALWMQGEQRYRAARFAEAATFYTRALAADSTFAAAALKAAQARSWTHQGESADALLQQALRFGDRLAPRQRLLARGLHYARAGFADSAVAALATADAVSGGWAEAAMALGEAQYHLLPTYISGEARARAAFARANAADSSFSPPLFHLAEMAVRDGRLVEGRVLRERLAVVRADPALVSQLELMDQCVASGPTEAWARRVAAEPTAGARAGKALSVGARQANCALAAFRAVSASPLANESDRWGAFLGMVHVLQARGLAPAAKALIDSTVAAGKGAARSYYVLAHAAEGTMAEDARALGTYARATFGDDLGRLRSPELLWLLSVLAQRSGDVAGVRTVRVQLEARAAASGSARDRAFLAANEAHLRLLEGDTTRAIALLQAVVMPATTAQLAWDVGTARAPDRLLLAELLLAAGRAREALAATEFVEHAEPITFVGVAAPALRIRHLAAARVGDAAAASEARRRLERLGRQDLLQ